MTIVLTGGEIKELNISLTPIPVEIASLSGMVTDFDSGVALHNAKVTTNGKSQLTDYWGRYRIEGLTVGSYAVTFEKNYYETQIKQVTLVAGENNLDITLECIFIIPTVAELLAAPTLEELERLWLLCTIAYWNGILVGDEYIMRRDAYNTRYDQLVPPPLGESNFYIPGASSLLTTATSLGWTCPTIPGEWAEVSRTPTQWFAAIRAYTYQGTPYWTDAERTHLIIILAVYWYTLGYQFTIPPEAVSYIVAPPPTVSASLSGTVTDTVTGAPVERCYVEPLLGYVSEHDLMIYTGATGTPGPAPGVYRIICIRGQAVSVCFIPGTCTIRFYRTGYISKIATVNLVSGSNVLNVKLQPKI